MSEEILKALMQLFAIIAKQDVGLSANERDYVNSFLKQQLNESSVQEYLALFDKFIGSDKNKEEEEKNDKVKLTSVKDSVKTLGIAKKINKTLTQEQKVVVLVRLFELINTDKSFTTQRIAIIDTAADVFNITKEEYKSIESFVINDDITKYDSSDIMVITSNKADVNANCKFIDHQSEESIIILRVSSVDLYFLKFNGEHELLLNGLSLNNQRIYLLASGSVLKPTKGKPVFYSDIAAKFLADTSFVNLNFSATDIEYRFPNGNIGLRNVNLSEGSGKLVAIMGASGAGKTTLLNVLSGMDTPTKGEVKINGINLHKEKHKTKGIIGYIPQDDLLIEELTVYDNLYYNAKLVFRNISEEEIDIRVNKVLNNLGLNHIKDLVVGNPLNKKISGGQRKRLNIGLELIREPAILFVDEPTSGLSSKDSENVMELLREITLRGKLVFVVIHQPSSEIYKMFDNVIILDNGGYQVYYGNPVEAIVHFKTIDNQINSDIGECPRCGTVNPETVFSIIEARIVDEYGRGTDKRKVTPLEWHKHYKDTIPSQAGTETYENLPEPTKIPGWFKQLKIYFTRDLFSKLANKQYLTLSLLEAPILGFLLAFVLRYVDDPSNPVYIFRRNDNVMPYIFMCTIVALFLGLIVSAEEIYKDRKILKREAFLNLSRSSYLFSKIGILFILSAIQAFLFVLVGNSIMGIKGMYFDYWLMFFSIAAFANVLGLNISSAFNSAVTIYILIPFLIIPQMVLTGAMFSFDKINTNIGGGNEKVPIIAEIMPSRWAFEALVVNQFVSNKYQKEFYELEKKEKNANYKNVYYIPKLKEIPENFKINFFRDKTVKLSQKDAELLQYELNRESKTTPQFKFNLTQSLTPDKFTTAIADSLIEHFALLQEHYKSLFLTFNEKRNEKISLMQNTPDKKDKFIKLFDTYYNDYLATFVKNAFAPLPVVKLNNKLVQKIDPIFLDPQDRRWSSFRTHFLAPKKNVGGKLVDTFWANVIVIWIFSIITYITLYYEHLKKFLNMFDKAKYRMAKKQNEETAEKIENPKKKA